MCDYDCLFLVVSAGVSHGAASTNRMCYSWPVHLHSKRCHSNGQDNQTGLPLTLCTDDMDIQMMKAELVDDINKRFADVTSQLFYAISTLVDPRYLGKLFLTTATGLCTAAARLAVKRCCVRSNAVANGHRTTCCQAACLDISPLELLAEKLGASAASETVSSQTATTTTLSVNVMEGALRTVSTHCKSGTALFVSASHVCNQWVALQHRW